MRKDWPVKDPNEEAHPVVNVASARCMHDKNRPRDGLLQAATPLGYSKTQWNKSSCCQDVMANSTPLPTSG